VVAHHLAYSPLPALIVLLPALAALLVRPIGRRSETLRNWFATGIAALTFAGAAALIPEIATHHRIGCQIPMLLGEITFEVDSFGMFFALFTSFVWMLSTLYAGDYMQHEQKRDRYHTFNLAVLAANMGVVLAGDLVTLYLFFEMLGLLAYMMVVHTETPEAKKASVKYLWMTVVGGVMLVAGVFLAFALGSNGAIGPIPLEEGTEVLRWAAAILMILGFGVKAGMLPVHIWLPDAHPVAPSPASALLSGIMIKAGAYGIFRVVTALFRPGVAEEIEEHLWHFTTQLGFVVLWLGIATMFIGVVLALLQENAKRMLAYHSISQMGFILAGIGAAGYLGAHGAMGYAGGLYHIINHALFKACLFLGVGAVYFRTHELNMYKLGGLWKKMPLTFLFTLIAACGITGVPLFNGFVSKTLIHHSIVESIEHAAHYYTAAQASSLRVGEIIYVITCGGTACSFIKLIAFVFLGHAKQEYGPQVREVPARMLTAMGALVVPIIGLGLAPKLILDGVLTPGLHAWGLHADILEHFTPFTGEALLSVVWAFGIGFAIFFVGIKTGAFHTHFPVWFSVDYWYRQGAHALTVGVDWTVRAYDGYLAWSSKMLTRGLRGITITALRSGRRWKRLIVTLTTGAPLLRHQQFIDAACVILERAKHDTVREAVTRSMDDLRDRDDLDVQELQDIVESARHIANYMATRLFHERKDILSQLVRYGRVEPVAAALDQVMTEVKCFREPVVQTALAYAEPRTRGDNVVRPISREMNKLMSEERFDVRLRHAMPAWSSHINKEGGVINTAKTAVSSYSADGHIALERTGHFLKGNSVVSTATAAVSTYGMDSLTHLERAGRFLSDFSSIAAKFILKERVPWMIEEHLDQEGVVAIRLAIQRYVRDISLNIGIVVAVLILFIVAILIG